MSTILSRIAVAAPIAAVIFGFGIGAANAAPMEISEHSQVGPQPDFADDFDNGDPENEPEDEPVDPPADEPADAPAEDDSEEAAEEADEESDDESDEAADDTDTDTDNSTKSVPAFNAVKTSNSSDGDKDASADDAVEAFQTTATELTPPSQRTPGVHIPVLALAAGGAMVAGVAGWAGYRRHRIFTS